MKKKDGAGGAPLFAREREKKTVSIFNSGKSGLLLKITNDGWELS